MLASALAFGLADGASRAGADGPPPAGAGMRFLASPTAFQAASSGAATTVVDGFLGSTVNRVMVVTAWDTTSLLRLAMSDADTATVLAWRALSAFSFPVTVSQAMVGAV